MSKIKVKSLTPKEAYDLVQSDPSALLVDVRSTFEYLFVGHPTDSVHVAWMDDPDFKVDPEFARNVRALTLGGICTEGGSAVPVLLICRSGKRSLEAGEELINEGFTKVYNVLEGFEGDLDKEHKRSTLGGWRFAGLPWAQC